jgi:hypothetical protein
MQYAKVNCHYKKADAWSENPTKLNKAKGKVAHLKANLNHTSQTKMWTRQARALATYKEMLVCGICTCHWAPLVQHCLLATRYWLACNCLLLYQVKWIVFKFHGTIEYWPVPRNQCWGHVFARVQSWRLSAPLKSPSKPVSPCVTYCFVFLDGFSELLAQYKCGTRRNHGTGQWPHMLLLLDLLFSPG